MKNYDDADEMLRFSWVGMFAVTSACSFVFYFLLLYVEGENIPLFLSIACIAGVLACVIYASEIFTRRSLKNRSKKPNIFQED